MIVIGSGISSLSSASFLAKEGHDVTIIEKNDQIFGTQFHPEKSQKTGMIVFNNFINL